MSTPTHVLDAVRAAVDRAFGSESPEGLAVTVNGACVGQLNVRLLARADLFSAISEAGDVMPPEVFARLRTTPPTFVPVLWEVGEFRGVMAHLPKGGLS